MVQTAISAKEARSTTDPHTHEPGGSSLPRSTPTTAAWAVSGVAEAAQPLAMGKRHAFQELIDEFVVIGIRVHGINVDRRHPKQHAVRNSPGQPEPDVDEPLMHGAPHRPVAHGEPVSHRLMACVHYGA